jgi:serine/threonine protein kinase
VNPDDFRRVEAVYNDALAIPAHERAAFLDRECAGDTGLRREVESLLSFQHRAETYMGEPAFQAVAKSLADETPDAFIDRMLGRYQLLSLVARGGMGEVYCAVDTRLNRLVAVKILPMYLAGDQERVQRFEQEARSTAILNHPHICILHDVGNDDGLHYLVFEYVVGEPLAERLAREGLPLTEAVEYATQIVDALVYAHEHGIIHLDLKPGNIMVTRSGVKLLDFGIAELRHPEPASSKADESGDNAKSRTMPGTLKYMAPEQLEGSRTDIRTDIFSLGALLYELFTQRAAFPSRALAAPGRIISTDDLPQRISEIRPEVPPDLDNIVFRCFAKEPSERWQSMPEILAQCLAIRTIIQRRNLLG